MGIFDKIKEFTNYIAGTGATLHVIVDNSMLVSEGLIRVKVLCEVKDLDILVDKLYIKLRAQESVKYRDSNYAGTGSRRSNMGGTNRTAYATTFKDELVIDRNFRLDAGGEYEWDAEFMIPPSIPGTYIGINARHEWSVLAGLSKKGNDPDSGWILFEV